MQEAYQQAFLAAPVTVLGKRLRPFALGHSYLLEACERPFARGGEVAPAELVFAVWICSRSFEDCITGLRAGDTATKCRMWGFKNRKADYNREMDIFDAYIADHSEVPLRWEVPGKQSSGPRVPWQIAMFWNLCSGRVDESLWDLPLGRAIVYSAARIASEGDDSLVSEDEWRVIDDGKS